MRTGTASMAQLKNQQTERERETDIDLKRMSITASEDSVTMDLTKEEELGEEVHVRRPDLSVYASQTPMHESMVFKIGGRNNLRRIQKRYFVLYPGMILYYHHRTTYARDKKHGLKDGKIIHLNGVHLSKPDSAPSRMKFCAVLHVPHESNKHKELLIGFHHKKDKNMWVELLQTQNATLKPSTSEETRSQKRLPLYIQKMREIEYYDPKSKYHMSRFHSLPNAISQKDLESLRTLYFSSSFSLPPGTGCNHNTLELGHNNKHLMLRGTDSETISEVDELGDRVDCEVTSISEDDNESC